MRVIVVPSNITDVYRICERLRPLDRAEAIGMGFDPKQAMRRQFRSGLLRKTYFVDGEVAAMSGMCGPLVSNIGHPYLVTTAAVEAVPVALVRHAKMAVAEMMTLRSRLEGVVLADYTGAVRLLGILGFKLGDPFKAANGAMFRSFILER